MTIRCIAILCGTVSIEVDRLNGYPGVEVYHVDGPDADDQIDLALLNDLVVRLKLVFIGGEEARRFAEMYQGTWIQDGPTAVGDVRRFWGISEPSPA